MGARIGITMRADEVAVVLQERSRRSDLLHLRLSTEVAHELPWDQVFDSIPARTRGRTIVLVALDRSRMRVKRLFGIAPDESEERVRGLLASSLESFFLGATGTLAAADPIRRADGWWAAAADARQVEAIAKAAAAVGVVLAGIVPIPPAAESEPLADVAWMVATLRESPAFIIDPLRSTRVARARRRGLSLLLAALAFLLTTAALAPTAAYRIQGERAASLAASIRRELDDSDASLRGLALTQAIARIETETRPVTEILGGLAIALPERSAIVQAVLDSAGVTLTVVAPVTVDLIGDYGDVRGLSRPALQGALARESALGMELQRATVTFSYVPSRTDGYRGSVHP
jgi:hypothetical protein